MSTSATTLPMSQPSRAEQMFPTLTSAQLVRLAAQGQVRHIQRGDSLNLPGEPARFFAVTSGEIQVVRPGSAGDVVVAVVGPGRFTGEISLLNGRRAFSHTRASESGDVIEVDRDAL